MRSRFLLEPEILQAAQLSTSAGDAQHLAGLVTKPGKKCRLGALGVGILLTLVVADAPADGLLLVQVQVKVDSKILRLNELGLFPM